MAPQPGTALRTDPLDLIRGQLGVKGLFVVEEMRYFEGPELPWIATNVPVVKTWYVKASLQTDPSFRGRFLVQRRSATLAGIAAVASFDSTGFRSPDWRSFEGEGPAKAYPGLPGTWPGISYDSVTGVGDGFPVLTRTSSGCLNGTGAIQTMLDPRTAGLVSTGAAHLEVNGGLEFTGDLEVDLPSVYIGGSSGDAFGMDATWAGSDGSRLALSGVPRSHTSSRFVLGLALGGQAFFVSKSGECTVTITLSQSAKVKGSFTCTGLTSSGVVVDVKGSFSGS